MPPQTQTEAMQKLTEEIKKLNEVMTIHNTEQKPIEEMVRNHETTLYGRKEPGSNPGLVSEVASIKKTLSNIDRALWIIITPFLAAIGTGIIYLVVTVSRVAP